MTREEILQEMRIQHLNVEAAGVKLHQLAMEYMTIDAKGDLETFANKIHISNIISSHGNACVYHADCMRRVLK